MVSVLDSGASGPGSGPGREHCVVFLGKTIYSHGDSPHSVVWMSIGEILRGNPGLASHPWGELKILQVANATQTGDKHQRVGSLARKALTY